MKIKVGLLFVLIIMVGATIAKKVPLEVKASLYNLTNYWGKGSSTSEYHSIRRQCERNLEGYDDRRVVEREWAEFFLQNLSKNIPLDLIWLPVSGDEVLMASYSGASDTSTNCWIAAAEYAGNLLRMYERANTEFEQTRKTIEFNFDSTAIIQRCAGLNRLAAIEKALIPTMYAVTNVFPSVILPTLSADEGATLYTNVLHRAGLVQETK